MGQTQTIGKHATSVSSEDNKYGFTSVTYHNTTVVKFDNNKIILNSGGYETMTTKVRMNQTANQYNLGYSVQQIKHVWYVNYGGKQYEFKDNMVLNRIGCKVNESEQPK